MLKNPFSPRLLKKAQMQGGVTQQMGTRYPSAGWVQVRDVLRPYVAAPRERAGYPLEVGGPPQVGLRRWIFFSSLLEDGPPAGREAPIARNMGHCSTTVSHLEHPRRVRVIPLWAVPSAGKAGFMEGCAPERTAIPFEAHSLLSFSPTILACLLDSSAQSSSTGNPLVVVNQGSKGDHQ